jgi:hypothetical protein
VAIFIDNQAVLRTLQARRTNNLSYAYIRIIDLLRKVNRSNEGIHIDTVWIPGHMDVDGNERADIAAKEAAAGNSNDTHELFPDFLRGKIPINPTAAKRTRRKRMDKEWKEWVGETERTERMRYLDKTCPSLTFSKNALKNHFTRQEYAHLVQLRLGHFPVPSYLHLFKVAKVDSPICPHCETRTETPVRILMGPRELEKLRRDRDRICGAASRSIRTLLEPGKHTQGLMFYIRRTRSQGRD